MQTLLAEMSRDGDERDPGERGDDARDARGEGIDGARGAGSAGGNGDAPVRRGHGSGGSPDEPEQFLWQGRLYLVRGVLGHWGGRVERWHVVAAAGLAAPAMVFSLTFDWSDGTWSVHPITLRGVGEEER